jgi:peroxiredoxin
MLPVLVALALAHPQESAPAAGHSVHGEAFNEGPRQAAKILHGMGNLRLEITTKDPRAQEFFNQGVGQLHGFFYFEAERSFRQAATLDPGCAMAYWGMAMANVNTEKRAKGFLEKAEKLRSAASPREQLWIQVLSNYYKLGAGEREKRARAYVKGLEAILHDFPDEVEARAFLAWALWYHKDRGLPISSHQAVEALIAEVLRANPMHPGAHHYRIHLWDEEKPARALGSAELFGPSSPGVAHAWHMPGHIYSKLHRYGEAARQQEASARVDHAHMIAFNIMPYQIHNFAHNNQWLVTDLAYVGRARDALALCENMIEIPRHPKSNRIEDKESCARLGRARYFETALRWELWDELAFRADTLLARIDMPDDRNLRARALGAAYFAMGDDEKGRAIVEDLESLVKAETDKPLPDEKEAKKRSDAEKARDEKLKPLRRAIDELNGRAKLARGEAKEAVDLLGKGDAPKSVLARAQLAAGDPGQAEKTAQAAVGAAPGQLAPLALQVEILVQAGKRDDAKTAARKMLELAGEADADLPVLKRLAPFLAEHGLRPAAARPPAMHLAALGPLLWRPPAAPGFSLSDADGKAFTLDRLAEGPLLLIFYLGSRCSHCVEQLGRFSGLVEGFRQAGIAVVAVSSEGPEDLRKARETDKAPLPFPLLPDPELQVFKTYRCFDDFEKIPLHGTFLLDRKGADGPRIRWQEISYEPFMEAKFLLEECRRLLSSGR